MRERNRSGVSQVRSLVAPGNPVPGDAFDGDWATVRWQAELRAIVSHPRQDAPAARARFRPVPPGRRWRVAGLAALAAATAAGVFLAAGIARAPGRAPGRTPALSVFSLPPGSTGAAGSSVPARSLLLTVAQTVARAPVATGRYWRIDTTFGNFRLVGPPTDRYLIVQQGREDNWLARRAADTSASVVQLLGVKLASAADAAAWRRDGSPVTWNIAPDVGAADPQGFAAADAAPVRIAAGRPRILAESSGPSELAYDGKPLSALPADPALLRTLLLAGYQGRNDGSAGSWLFQAAFGLLADPVTPAVRSAVYRLLAGLPGVRSLGPVRDVAGQEGAGIALDGRQSRCLIPGSMLDASGSGPPTSSCVVQQRLIINPVTGMLLAQELRYLTPPAGQRWPAPGGLFSYEVFGSSAWTSRTPPGGTSP
ncbi:MAG TPA: hypothetical protein VGL63_03805 [Streptosporangiaceae bacterium]